MMNKLKLLTLGGLVSLFSLSAIAEWTMIADFEGVAYDDFDLWKRYPPQGDLYLSGFDPINTSNGHYYADPGPQLDGENNQIWTAFTLPTPVADGATATIKYDLYFFSSGPYNLNIGLSDNAVVIDELLSKQDGQMLEPNSYGSFESQVAWGNATGAVNVRNGSGFTVTDTFYPVGEWFTFYHVLDNANDVSYFYIKSAADSEPVPVTLPDSTFALFRNGTSDPLITWTVVSAGSFDGPIGVYMLDNLQIDTTGVNLDGGTHVGGSFWAGYPQVDEAGNVDTGNWLGWINVASGDWVYVFDLATFIYLPEELVSSSGSWTYVPNF